ncbi:alpha/beta fold hydrolase [Actinocatenispora rupis]|uniref:Alpha/beta hydrolase n=1 Tax=Actinocatenispora rupis TaxID=519421 RepID=A0A8J3JK14_9ACTN|nr:alpha/beta hydrolase [Actinocatenispora rupis]GID16338.1 alpha/beta hydrolase [Actinocatenispora rupis]
MTLTHDIAGTGPTVVLLHAGVCDRRMWDPQWQPLIDAGHRVVRCDFRGFGETPAATGPYRDDDDVHDLLDTLGLDRVTLVACSYGALIALLVAARWPDRVTDLVLLSPNRLGHEPGPELRAFGAREDELLEAGDIAGATELNVDMWLGPDADDTARQHVREQQRHAFEVQLAADEYPSPDAPADLARIRARSYLVSGAKDVSDFRQIAAELADLLPDATHVELPWAGHLPTMERPAEATDLILAALRR